MSEHQATATDAPPAFEVRLSGDKLSMYVSAPDPHANLEATATLIAAELPPLELAVDIGTDILSDLLAQACAPGEHLVDFPLLVGDMPVPPRDGEIQWQDDFFASGFALDEDRDKMDYWERAEKRAVEQDQLVAIVLQPLEGTPGRTLQGNEVPVPKPKPARLRAGKGIRTEDEDDRVLYHAAVAGRLNHKDGTVSVDEVYTIRGNVSLETGNIKHTGALVVQGDVTEGATIECDGEIVIKGLVEPANITGGANLTVAGGIVGDPEHAITVAGDVQARYLNDVNLRCEGNVTVTSQIDHSEVLCCGRVEIPRGRIAGGKVMAYRGIQVGHAGSRGATGTTLIAGSDYRIEARQQAHRERMTKLQGAREQITDTLAKTLAQGALDEARRKVVEHLKSKIAQIDEALKTQAEAQNHELEEAARGGVREVAVLLELWSGVTFRLGGSVAISDRSYDKPRLVTLRRDKVRILPMGEMNTPS
jgi:uncharacterized protein (DUF342 family)